MWIHEKSLPISLKSIFFLLHLINLINIIKNWFSSQFHNLKSKAVLCKKIKYGNRHNGVWLFMKKCVEIMQWDLNTPLCWRELSRSVLSVRIPRLQPCFPPWVCGWTTPCSSHSGLTCKGTQLYNIHGVATYYNTILTKTECCTKYF